MKRKHAPRKRKSETQTQNRATCDKYHDQCGGEKEKEQHKTNPAYVRYVCCEKAGLRIWRNDMSDEIVNGMMEAEFSEKQRGSMLPDAVIAQYRALDFRPRVPYTPPVVVEISQPKPVSVLTPENKVFAFRVGVVFSFAAIYAERAAIVAIATPIISGAVGIAIAAGAVGLLYSCFSGGGSGEAKSGTAGGATIINNYTQHIYQGSGPQNNNQT